MNRLARTPFLAICIGFGMLLSTATSASAITKCKVKVDKKTGVIRVDASGLGGAILWGGESGMENTAFFNDATCVASGSAKKCELADPATLAAATPPESCRIYLDDGVATCDAWIPGCIPGPRTTVTDTNGPMNCFDVLSIVAVGAFSTYDINPTCGPSATVTGGGYEFAAVTTNLLATQSSQRTNGWRCRGVNNTGGLVNLTCYARCCSVP